MCSHTICSSGYKESLQAVELDQCYATQAIGIRRSISGCFTGLVRAALETPLLNGAELLLSPWHIILFIEFVSYLAFPYDRLADDLLTSMDGQWGNRISVLCRAFLYRQFKSAVILRGSIFQSVAVIFSFSRCYAVAYPYGIFVQEPIRLSHQYLCYPHRVKKPGFRLF